MNDLQMPLLFAPSYRITPVSRRGTIAERFEAFVEANPHVVAAVVEIARTMLRSGQKRIGMKAIWEVARWEYVRATRDGSGWKLNNDFTAPMARYVAANYPDLADAFEFRSRRAA